jgi:Asp-tRNA(Asn)/Glu-tRNA(Gln) amidotransferase A subunit family amidase
MRPSCRAWRLPPSTRNGCASGRRIIPSTSVAASMRATPSRPCTTWRRCRGAVRSCAHLGRDVFSAVDVFATPTIRMKVPTLAATDIDAGAPGAIEAFAVISANTRAINFMGLPSVSVPCGFDSFGLPIGFQVQGRPFAEARVLKVADAFQQDTDWHDRVPAVSAR